jgi:hypothetical protein
MTEEKALILPDTQRKMEIAFPNASAEAETSS